MKKIVLLFALLASATVIFAQSKIVRSSVTYQVKNMGINTEGKFTALQADIRFDPAQPATSSIEASVDVNSVNSANDTRDEHLRGEKFFDAAHYPKLTLKSVKLERKGGNKYAGKFDLTIKGITKPVTIPFTYTEANDKAIFNGSFKINRKDFNVGGSSMVLADEVTINLMAEVVK